MRLDARSQQSTSMQGAGSMHDGACSTCLKNEYVGTFDASSISTAPREDCSCFWQGEGGGRTGRTGSSYYPGPEAHAADTYMLLT